MWHRVRKGRAGDLKCRTENAEFGSRPCRTDVGTDPDRVPQIHDLEPICSCHGLDDKLNRGMGVRGREGRSQGQNKGGCPQPVLISAEGLQGSRLSVRQISLSPLKLMRGRGPVGNDSQLVAMFSYNGSSGWRRETPAEVVLRSVFIVFALTGAYWCVFV